MPAPTFPAVPVGFDITPADLGFLTWTVNPVCCGIGGVSPSAGIVYLNRIPVTEPILASSISLFCDVIATAELANMFVGIYAMDGTRLATSADISGAHEVSAGWKTHALVTPITLQPGNYFIGIVVGTQGATPLKLGRSGGQNAHGLQSGLLPATRALCATVAAGGQTSLPATVIVTTVTVNSVYAAGIS